MTDEKPQGCLFGIFKLLGLAPGGGGNSAGPAAPGMPYRRKEALLTGAERSFFGVLQQVAGERYELFAMVRLADLIEVVPGTEKWRSHFNRIQSKHVDFALCDERTLQPLLAIELDDSSHSRQKRQERDAFVDAALEEAGLRLLRVPARKGYELEELRRAIDGALNA